MEISSVSNKITINGNIKSISDFQKIKAHIDTVISQHKNITIDILDSLSITSSVIGYFNKIILKDKIDIQMNVKNHQLMALLIDLNLATLFKAHKG